LRALLRLARASPRLSHGSSRTALIVIYSHAHRTRSRFGARAHAAIGLRAGCLIRFIIARVCALARRGLAITRAAAMDIALSVCAAVTRGLRGSLPHQHNISTLRINADLSACVRTRAWFEKLAGSFATRATRSYHLA